MAEMMLHFSMIKSIDLNDKFSKSAITRFYTNFILYFSVDTKILARDLLADTNVEVSPDGTVSWTAPALFKSSCNINVGAYSYSFIT